MQSRVTKLTASASVQAGCGVEATHVVTVRDDRERIRENSRIQRPLGLAARHPFGTAAALLPAHAGLFFASAKWPTYPEVIVLARQDYATTRTQSTAHFIHLEWKHNAEYRRGLRRDVHEALEQGRRRIVFDCSSWPQLDLILLSTLVNCAKDCTEQGADFELANLRTDIQDRIEALRLGDRLGLHVPANP